MRAVVQRVCEASVIVSGEMVSSIGRGLLVYLGVETTDTEAEARYLAEKIRYLRIFPDELKPMNRDVIEVGGAILLVSAFTTAGDARKGRRPSFDNAAAGEAAEPLYERACELLEGYGLSVGRGRFGASMQVRSINDGPVCILLDSGRAF